MELLGGSNCFTPEQYNKIIEIINDKLTGCLTSEKERQDQRTDEDYDEQVEEELEEEVRIWQQYLSSVHIIYLVGRK